MKIFPFLNWFGRKTLNLDQLLSKDIQKLNNISESFDKRMLNFERLLSDNGLYTEYIELRKHANEVKRLEEMVEDRMIFINFDRKL